MGNKFKVNISSICHHPKDSEKEEKLNSERPWANPELRESHQRLSRKPSWVSPSQPSEDSPEEVVSRESAPSSMMRPELFSRASSKTSSETQSPTLSMPRERPSPHSMSSMLSRDKAEPSMVSVDELVVVSYVTLYHTNLQFVKLYH